jgi:carbamoyl-phosphate synthase small subunit
MLSNGPGDPKDCTLIIKEIKKLYDSGIPIYAVCLGHQLLALANGCDTEKLKYGHRGANHPVRDLATGRVHITSQNHGYVVTADSVDKSVAEISHINVNDNTVEGLRYANGRAFTAQFHPEASPGPADNEYLFDRFMDLMGGGAYAKKQ